MAAVAPLDAPPATSATASAAAMNASIARLRSLQASRATLRSQRRTSAQSNQTLAQQSVNRVLLQARRDEERHFRCQFFTAIGLAVMGGFMCVAGVGMIVYGLPTPDRMRRDFGQLSQRDQVHMEVHLMLYGRLGGILLGGGIFFIIVLLVIGLDYKMYLDRQKPARNATAEMNKRLYTNIMQNLRRAAEDADSSSLSTSHRSSDRRSSLAVTLVANGASSATVQPSRPSTAAGRWGSQVNLIRRNSLPVKEQQPIHRRQLSPTWKVNEAFDFSEEAVEQIKGLDGGETAGSGGCGVTCLEELFARPAVGSPKFQIENIAEELSALATSAVATDGARTATEPAVTAFTETATASSSATTTTTIATTDSDKTVVATNVATAVTATTSTVTITTTTTVTATGPAAVGGSSLPVAASTISRTTVAIPNGAMPSPAELVDGAPENREPTAVAARRPPLPVQTPRRQQTAASRRASVAKPTSAAVSGPVASGTAATETTRLKTASAATNQNRMQQTARQQQHQQQRPATGNSSGTTTRSATPGAARTTRTPAAPVATAVSTSTTKESRPTTAAAPDSRPTTAAVSREYTMVFDSDHDDEPSLRSSRSSSSSASDEELLYQQCSGLSSGGGIGGGDSGGGPNVGGSQNNLNRLGEAEKPLKAKLWREDTTDENASESTTIEDMTRELCHNLELDNRGPPVTAGPALGGASSDPGFSVQVHVHVHVSRNNSPNRQQQVEKQQLQPQAPLRSKVKMLNFEQSDGAI